MLMQEFCRVTGLGRETVRFYVRRGLLTPTVGAPSRGAAWPGRPANRYQVFDQAQVERARLIRSAQRMGFTLREIAALAHEYERTGTSRRRRVEIMRAHLDLLEARAAALSQVRRYLRAKLEWIEAGERGPAPQFAAGLTEDVVPSVDVVESAEHVQ